MITRKAYGGAYDVMNSKHIRGDVNLAWPHGRDRGDGPEGRRRDPVPEGDRRKPTIPRRPRTRASSEYRETFAHPYIAASRGYVDDVIDPRETRPRLISALDMLRNKRDENPPRKHGNIPL